MSEFWVSHKKIYCKYCKIYIADDHPSRLSHDTGLKHKGNVERYIRDIYKRGEQQQKDAAQEASEIARMEAAAHAAMNTTASGSGSAPPQRKPRVVAGAAARSDDPFANYSTAESLGYIDHEANRIAAEVEVRNKEGTVGEWEKVVRPITKFKSSSSFASTSAIKLEDGTCVKEEDDQNDIKRAAEAEEQEKDDRLAERNDHRRFLQVKSIATPDEYDPSTMTTGIKLKRQRLTLREETEIQEKATLAAKVKREREEEVERLNEERYAAGPGGDGWNQIEIDEEELIDLDHLASEPEKEDPLEVKVKVEGNDIALPPPPVAAVGGGGGFKKRKMMGASAVKKR